MTPLKLFISYRGLNSDKVDSLVTRLRLLKDEGNNPRFDVWQDKVSIPSGHNWWDKIIDAITDCNIFIFMVSRDSVHSEACLAELSYAHKRNRPIVPFVLENEFIYNEITGKYDINYWTIVPSELRDFQFLYYDGTSFISQLETAFAEFKRDADRWQDTPAPRPPAPSMTLASNQDNLTEVRSPSASTYFEKDEKVLERLWQFIPSPYIGDLSNDIKKLKRVNFALYKSNIQEYVHLRQDTLNNDFRNTRLQKVFQRFDEVVGTLAREITSSYAAMQLATRSPEGYSYDEGYIDLQSSLRLIRPEEWIEYLGKLDTLADEIKARHDVIVKAIMEIFPDFP